MTVVCHTICVTRRSRYLVTRSEQSEQYVMARQDHRQREGNRVALVIVNRLREFYLAVYLYMTYEFIRSLDHRYKSEKLATCRNRMLLPTPIS